MRCAIGAMSVCAALLLAGCGSAQQAIQSKVQQLSQAASARDYGTICRQVLSPAFVERIVLNTQLSCEEAVRVALSRVRDPMISVGKIVVRGRQASAITLTLARGERASLAVIDLVDTGDGWRISSLGSSLTAALSGAGR